MNVFLEWDRIPFITINQRTRSAADYKYSGATSRDLAVIVPNIVDLLYLIVPHV